MTNEEILNEIAALEAQVTNRRLREMVTPEGRAWVADIEAQIEVLRGQLTQG